jgi:hypothetical protein
MGVNRFWRTRRRPGDKPNGYARKNGRNKSWDRYRFLPTQLVTPLQVPEVHQAGPAIFAIDELKDRCHGINSVVDHGLTLPRQCFRRVSLPGKNDVVELKSGFVEG